VGSRLSPATCKRTLTIGIAKPPMSSTAVIGYRLYRPTPCAPRRASSALYGKVFSIPAADSPIAASGVNS
jgi:hypothetical protein